MKVGILGGGESGTGAALLARKVGDKPFISDSGQIREKYKKELIDNHVRFEEGGHQFDILVDSDLIVISPGIPFNVPIVTQLMDAGIRVVSEMEYAYQYMKELKDS